MEILIKMIKNHPIDSNCFVIYNDLNSNCIVVDPGTEDCKELLSFLQENNLVPQNIILTHEHFDHIWGVNKLIKIFNCAIVCTEKCLDNIINKKKNLSVFYDQVGFEILAKNNTILVSNNDLKLENYVFKFKETPGHSEGSVSFWIDKYLFMGDVFIKGIKTVTKLPGGSKKQLTETIYELSELFSDDKMMVYPGHGEVMAFNEIDFSKVL